MFVALVAGTRARAMAKNVLTVDMLMESGGEDDLEAVSITHVTLASLIEL